MLHRTRDPYRRWALPALPLLVALVYGWTFPGSFFIDDVEIVQTNLLVYAPDLKAIFTSDYWGGGENSGLFRPLTILSFAVNRLLLGDDASGYLLVNLLLHAGVCILLYRFLQQVGLSSMAAWFAAALFAVHPMHAEPVVELVGRSELLAALFGLSALSVCRRRGRWSSPLVVLFFVAAILSKEHGVVLLALIPAIDLFLDRPSWRELVRRRGALLGGLAGITVAWLIYRARVVHYGIPAPPSVDPYYIPLATVDASTRILSALKLQILYLGKLFAPIHLQGMYPVSTVKPFIGWLSFWGVAIILGLGLLAALAWQGWRHRRWWGLAIVLYAISFAPTSNVFFAAGFTMADRVVYFPSLWFCAGLSACLHFLMQGWPRKQALALLVTLLTVYAGMGVARALDFRTPETLWRSGLASDPDNEMAQLMLVNCLRGERSEEAAKIVEALVRAKPDFKVAWESYAWLLIDLGRPVEAVAAAKRAIALEPPGSVSASKLPLAAAYIKLGRLAEAAASLEMVRTTDFQHPIYWELRGKLLEAQGNLLGALSCYQREASLSGGRSPDGLRRLGRVLLQLNQLGEAETALRRDVRLNPGNAEGWHLLGTALARQGKQDEATEALRRAVELQPESREYRASLERWGRR